MDDLLKNLFPFVTRNMLQFGKEANMELIVQSRASVASNLTVRLITRDGFSEFTHATATGATVTSSLHKIHDVPIFLSVKDDGEAYTQGQAYVTVSLRINGEIVYEFFSGYVYFQKGLSWPAAVQTDTVPGRGIIRAVQGTNPAAGAEVSQTVPTGRTWNIFAISFQLVADATAANRTPHLTLTVPSGPVIRMWGTTAQTASQTRNYHYAQFADVTDASDDDDFAVGLPLGLLLPAGSTITTETVNLQAADDYGVPSFLIEEFLSNVAV